MSRLRARFGDEQGMTIVELAISMGLLGLVIAPITVAMIFGLVHTPGARDRIADSASAQLLSSFLPTDIQSADEVFLTGTGGCPSALGGGETVRLRLTWTHPADPSARRTATYFTRSTADGLQLHRAFCSGGAQSTSLLVHHVDGATGFTVRCDGVAGCASPTPREVGVTLRAFNASSDSASYDPSEYVLEAVRRAG